jgi:hypothetical protein
VSLFGVIFGEKPVARRAEPIDSPPDGARLRRVRARQGPPRRAWLAEADCRIDTRRGSLLARGGKDFILAHGPGDHSVIRRDIFEATYEPLGGGHFRKRTDVILRYFTLKRRVLVQTLEGLQAAEPGDWIMQGIAGELWPVGAEKARQKYRPA